MFKKNFLLRPILAILIIFIPLYPKFPLFNVDGTYVAIRLDDIVVAVSVLIYLIYQIKYRFPVLKQKITLLFLAYFIAIIISTINAVFIFQTDPLNILLLNLFRRFEYISLFFLTIETLRQSIVLRPYYLFLLFTTIGIAAYGFGQKYFFLPVVSTMNSEFSKGQLLQMNTWTRISSTFAGHYDLAVYLSLVLIIFGIATVLEKNIFLKIISSILWLVFYYLLNLTASRVSTFAYFGGIILALILVRRYWWIIPFTCLFIFSILNSKDLNQRLLATIPAFKSQFLSQTKTTPVITPVPTIILTPIPLPTTIPGTIAAKPKPTIFRHQPLDEYISPDVDAGVARSGEIRFNVEWPRAITAFRKNSFSGTGLGSLTLATDNDYLRLLGESGLLGLITFLSIPFYFFLKTIPHIFKKKLVSSDYPILILFSAMVTFLVNAIMIDVFEASKTAYLFWIMMGFYYVLLQNKSHET